MVCYLGEQTKQQKGAACLLPAVAISSKAQCPTKCFWLCPARRLAHGKAILPRVLWKLYRTDCENKIKGLQQQQKITPYISKRCCFEFMHNYLCRGEILCDHADLCNVSKSLYVTGVSKHHGSQRRKASAAAVWTHHYGFYSNIRQRVRELLSCHGWSRGLGLGGGASWYRRCAGDGERDSGNQGRKQSLPWGRQQGRGTEHSMCQTNSGLQKRPSAFLPCCGTGMGEFTEAIICSTSTIITSKWKIEFA